MRTIKEIIEKGYPEDSDPTEVHKMIMAAYWYGQHVAAKRLGDQAKSAVDTMRNRAKKCRYHKMAQEVIGKYQPYDGSYGDAEIGDWEFNEYHLDKN